MRKRFERFCFRHRNKGIPNLMLYITLGSGLVYLFTIATQNPLLFNTLCFSRAAILQGQVWRLITFPLAYSTGNLLLTLISLVCYFSLGRAIENVWGSLRFNLFYFSGMLMMDVFCMFFGGYADALHLNLSLFLAYATMYPNAQFLFLFIIPVKAWIFAMIDLGVMILDVVNMTMAGYFPYSLFPFVALLNYFLFFGKDVVNVIPISWQANFRRLFRKKKKSDSAQKPIPFPSAGSYEASVASVKAPYNHRCTVCGRTDVSDPDLEFRYCSRCNGYYCYCSDHINNHTHVE